jgi:hypothetical protein
VLFRSTSRAVPPPAFFSDTISRQNPDPTSSRCRQEFCSSLFSSRFNEIQRPRNANARRQRRGSAPAVGFGGFFPVCYAIKSHFAQVIKQTRSLLGRTLSLFFAGNSAGTLAPGLPLTGYKSRLAPFRRRLARSSASMPIQKGNGCAGADSDRPAQAADWDAVFPR